MISTSLFTTEQILYVSAAVTIAITILYLLKLRKKRIEVPFSPIWQKVLAPSAELQNWRKYLRRILSWLFYLIIAALIVFAIYDPHSANEATKSRHVLILLDNSASMASTDVSGAVTRLDLAKKKIAKLLRSFDSHDRVMLATFNDVVQPQTPFTSEISFIQSALENLQPSASATNFNNALLFAADALAKMETSELIIVTDGASPSFATILTSHPTDFTNDSDTDDDEPADEQGKTKSDIDAKSKDGSNKPRDAAADTNPPIPLQDHGPTYAERLKNTTIQFIGLGEANDNLAITAFKARRYLANRLDFELLVQVQSYFDREIDAEIDLYADGKLIETKPIHLEPRALYQQFYPGEAISGERLEARIRIATNDAQDIFPMDDHAFTVLNKEEIIDVLLVTNGNLYLEGPLLLNPNIRLKRISTSDYKELTTDVLKKYPVIIFDNFVAPTPEEANVLYINPTSNSSPWTLTGSTITDPIIARVRRTHPLMRWLSLQDLNIRIANRTKLTRDDLMVAGAVDGTPMIVARTIGATRKVAVMFDIRNSDLPLRVAFPVFMINVLDWFTGDTGTLSTSLETGVSWQISVPDGVTSVEIVRPNQSREKFPVFDHHAFIYGSEAGFYDIHSLPPEPDFHTTIAANLSNRRESDVTPHKLELTAAVKSTTSDSKIIARQNPWIWLVVAAFILLFLEWFTFNRRVTE